MYLGGTYNEQELYPLIIGGEKDLVLFLVSLSRKGALLKK